MKPTIPLIHRNLNDSIAIVSNSLACLRGVCGDVSARQFLAHCSSLAERLPERDYAINLCDNRYLFLVSFCAALLRGQTNLLPPNKNKATQAKLRSKYNASYVLHDGSADIDACAESLNIETLVLDDGAGEQVPAIAADHLAAISFTSGSTGDSKPILKYWGSLWTSSCINRTHMLNVKHSTLYMLATVPAQHMWGLETSIFLPLHHNVCSLDSRPLYPADVIQNLKSLPVPRCLVTTPVHLRSLLGAKLSCPNLSLILCATSPLSPALAKHAEQAFLGEVREVYGCSEVGSMAYRNTVNDSCWNLFEGITFERTGEKLVVKTDHLLGDIVVQDSIELVGPSQFKLMGRSGDMIDIAGKRGSLQEINQVLHSFAGAIDGIVFMPPCDNTRSSVTRLAAIVALKEDVQKQELRRYFAEHLDSAFVPRPILIVEKIQREENGKLPLGKVHDMYRSLSKSNATSE